jgi:hypothetical protein
MVESVLTILPLLVIIILRGYLLQSKSAIKQDFDGGHESRT